MQLSRIADDMTGSEASNQAKLLKYLHLSNAILDRIEAGEMRSGDKLPLAACKTLGLAAGSRGMVWEVLGRTHRRQPASYQRVNLPAGHRPIERTSIA